MKDEKFILKVLGLNVMVKHTGNTFFINQINGIKELVDYLTVRIQKGERNGFVPYNNFECSFRWSVE